MTTGQPRASRGGREGKVITASERRPGRGAVAVHVKPGYQACTLNLRASPPGEGRYRARRPGSSDSARLPRLVARGCPVAVPYWLLFYAAVGRKESLGRHQFVTSIDPVVSFVTAGACLVPANARMGQPRRSAILRSARSGLTTRGWPTTSSMGRSVMESL